MFKLLFLKANDTIMLSAYNFPTFRMCDSPGSNQYKCIKYYILGIFFISIFALLYFWTLCSIWVRSSYRRTLRWDTLLYFSWHETNFSKLKLMTKLFWFSKWIKEQLRLNLQFLNRNVSNKRIIKRQVCLQT